MEQTASVLDLNVATILRPLNPLHRKLTVASTVVKIDEHFGVVLLHRRDKLASKHPGIRLGVNLELDRKGSMGRCHLEDRVLFVIEGSIDQR